MTDCKTDEKKYPQQIELEIIPRTVDLGGFDASRVLPTKQKRTVGPFIFWDQMGPGEFLTGTGIDVRPHPHIGLSTMTYLLSGTLEHRDTLGTFQVIVPGEVNVMTAGRGIAHSERTPQKERAQSHDLWGIQCWLALPLHQEEMEPDFKHYAQKVIPVHNDRHGITFRVVAGEWMGLKSPVNMHTDGLFIEWGLPAASQVSIPSIAEEQAIYILSGEVSIDNVRFKSNRMLILRPGSEVKITAMTHSMFVLLGGAPLDKPRYLWWNFASSSKERIEQAKQDWKEGVFGTIPGDDDEFIPLPE
ncbi:pirin family protein [Legionella worsleiensis]|uniref:Pirin n=1 Tax=Legionella worsleiensis TaxID=45076 RepID=A0A0W1A5W1_9GAMM|nr:pirin family protein [Legionella worsleiensis]KTD76734.1 pirin [Legionella worsleiensis]STY30523.1 pirin [Legionella worsleiensis]